MLRFEKHSLKLICVQVLQSKRNLDFVESRRSSSDFARPVHDDLYRAIDIYLKEHPELSKSERKSICRLLDY